MQNASYNHFVCVHGTDISIRQGRFLLIPSSFSFFQFLFLHFFVILGPADVNRALFPGSRLYFFPAVRRLIFLTRLCIFYYFQSLIRL